MEPERKFVIPAHVVWRQVGDEILILDVGQSCYFGLDPVGARVWKLLSDGCRLPDLLTTLLEEFDVAADRLQQDVDGLIKELADRGLIEVV